MAVSPQITPSLSVGPDDVVYASAYLGSTMVASLQLLDSLRRPAEASGVTFVFRRPDGVEIEVVGDPSEPVPAPKRWLGYMELTMAGTWAVRAVSLIPYRLVDWTAFQVDAEPQEVRAPYAALWLQQDNQITATTTGGLISAARIDLLPLVDPEEGLKFAGVTAGGASVRIDYGVLKAGAAAAAEISGAEAGAIAAAAAVAETLANSIQWDDGTYVEFG